MTHKCSFPNALALVSMLEWRRKWGHAFNDQKVVYVEECPTFWKCLDGVSEDMSSQ
jgi:hypothetical protein